MHNTFNHPLCEKYGPSLSYQRAFLKYVIGKIEEGGGEVNEEIYEKYIELIAEPVSAEETCFKTYFVDDEKRITLQESTSLISHGTTGMCTWQAAKFLAEWVVENKETIKGRNVLELGSGVGLTGLVASTCCSPANYVFTDCHGQVLELLRHNVILNCRLAQRQARLESCGAEGQTELDGICCVNSQTGLENCHANSYHMARFGDVSGVIDEEQSPVDTGSVHWKDEAESCKQCGDCSGVGDNATQKKDCTAENVPDGRGQGCVQGHLRNTNTLKCDVCLQSCSVYSSSYDTAARVKHSENGDSCSNDAGDRPWRSDIEKSFFHTSVSELISKVQSTCVDVCDMYVLEMDWETIEESDLKALAKNTDVLLAADVVYDVSIVAALVRVIGTLLRHGVSAMYIASTVRNTDTKHAFITAVEAAGMFHKHLAGPCLSLFDYEKATPIELVKILASQLETGPE